MFVPPCTHVDCWISPPKSGKRVLKGEGERGYARFQTFKALSLSLSLSPPLSLTISLTLTLTRTIAGPTLTSDEGNISNDSRIDKVVVVDVAVVDLVPNEER